MRLGLNKSTIQIHVLITFHKSDFIGRKSRLKFYESSLIEIFSYFTFLRRFINRLVLNLLEQFNITQNSENSHKSCEFRNVVNFIKIMFVI